MLGTWGDPEARDTPSLVFEIESGGESGDDAEATEAGEAADADEAEEAEADTRNAQRYHGTDGCNRVGGTWSAEGSTIDLGSMFSTLMYCEWVDAWLSQARTAELSGDELTFFDESGAEIGVLQRTG